MTDPAVVVVADTSTVINLNATDAAQDILTALPNRLVVVDSVVAELDEGRRRKRQDADLLKGLVAAGHIEVVSLDESALQHFEELVIGPAAETLDDGEAATIAYSIAYGAMPLVDERKAIRICAERFPELLLGCTVDIFTHPEMLRCLGTEALAGAVFKALYHGRMRVFPQHIAWVIALIGPEQAALCTSLPGSVRAPHAEAAGAKPPP